MKKIVCFLLSIFFILVTFTFGGCYGTELKDFQYVSFVNKTFVYSGESKLSEIKVINVPSGAQVSYKFYNESGVEVFDIVECGNYISYATISKTGYHDKTLSASITVNEPEVDPNTIPDFDYVETIEDIFLIDTGEIEIFDFDSLISEQTKIQKLKYNSANWIIRSIGKMSPVDICLQSNIVDVDSIKKEQYTVQLVGTYNQTEHTIFTGKVDFFDLINDGVVWNDISSDGLAYMAYRCVASCGIEYKSDLFYPDIIEAGECYTMKDDIFDYTDEELEEEINQRIKQINNIPIPTYDDFTKNNGWKSCLNCALMLKPLHSKEYYTSYVTESQFLHIDYCLYTESDGAEGKKRNVNDFSNGSVNMAVDVNTWLSTEIRVIGTGGLMFYYDNIMSAQCDIQTLSTGGHTALLGLMHDQINYVSDPTTFCTLKVEMILMGFTIE